ncbi:hypothetical protein DIURU_003060 [Diutina rugosa]|uniref:tRNA-dihydrouridine(47) synthase [NAD(P)(+)] n=1 Tax=Diutina rugosa TaxID=5481 RepID=A0A642UMZ0_DIURU|nr:uncharacterized protein DIURU_003060 [Diutina rugosa]KAA8902009.1 hypothetical protein DIURU_003060 [Diutina rugosa]
MRAFMPDAEPPTKRQRTSDESSAETTYQKGYAPVKAEFIVQDKPQASYDDDAAEKGGHHETAKPQKGKKQRGQNKNRDFKQSHHEARLCSTKIDPDNLQECSFGDKCKNIHDIDLYLKEKLPDIDGVCPVFKALGYCPSGLKCRWLGSHYKDGHLVKSDTINEPGEINKIANDHKFAMQKKKYEWGISDDVTKWMDSIINNDENREKRKENQATFVEQPPRPAEKKRIHLKGAKIVSPLTTVGNLPYRRLMKSMGADVTYCEMALSVPLVSGHNPEWALPKAHKSEYPGFGVQIAAAKHWSAAKAAEAIYRETSHVSELNLNCGCPIDLLYKQGQGSALMDQPARLCRLLKAMNMSSGDIPVTVKIRTGTKDGKNTAKQLVERVLGENDVAAITLHGRSRQQRYTRDADWDYIAEVGRTVQEWNVRKQEDKDRCDLPDTFFIGNGDIFNHEDWYRETSKEGIDSVMVARGALIKPWIFEEVAAGQYLDKSASERLAMLKTYADYAIEHWGSDEPGVAQARRFMCEFMSFTHRYVPVGILERADIKINDRPPMWKGRNELETLLGSGDYRDWIKVTEMFLGPAKDFSFTPKHKSSAYPAEKSS